MSNNNTKFYWQATESGVGTYPMEIVKGYFWYHGDPGNGLYVPNKALLTKGWGKRRSSHNVGAALKPLPDRLTITYFSYAENKFYEGDFKLPYEKILALFQQNVPGLDRQEPRDYRQRDYDAMMVGVAPGGSVAVWVMGRGVKEVFFGQAREVKSELSMFGEVISDLDDYAKDVLAESEGAEVVADIEKNGVPIQNWPTYRTRYNWRPAFAVSHPPTEFGMESYNGEASNYYAPFEPEFTTEKFPVPREIDFHYAVNGEGIEYFYIIHFDEQEMLQAFSKLGANQEKLQLLFEPKVPIELTQIYLQSEKEVITLKKFHIKHID